MRRVVNEYISALGVVWAGLTALMVVAAVAIALFVKG